MNELILNTAKTMSSTEIAELTGKEKHHIHRDIKNQIVKNLYGMDNPKLDNLDIKGLFIKLDDRGFVKEIHLDRYHTDILISGYEVKYRAAIVKRWHELEQTVAPKTFIEPEDRAKAKLEALLGISKLLKVPEHHAMGISCKQIDAELGTSLVPLLKYSTAMVNIPEEDKLLEVTEIGKMFGGLSGQKVNKILEVEGYQVKVNGEWQATEAGKPYSFVNSFVSPYSGKSGYNLKWNVEFAKRVIGEAQ